MNNEDLSNVIDDCESNIHYNSDKLREHVFFADNYNEKSLKDILRHATLIRMYADILIKEVSCKL